MADGPTCATGELALLGSNNSTTVPAAAGDGGDVRKKIGRH